MYFNHLKKTKHFILSVIMTFALMSITYGQSQISKNVATVKTKIQLERQINPIQEIETPTTQQKTLLSEVPGALLLKIDETKMSSMLKERAEYLHMTIPSLNDENLELLLYKYELHSPGFVSRTGSGRLFQSSGVFYHGIVKGQDRSLVAISVFENELIGMIQMEDKQLTLTKINDERPYHLLYDNAVLDGKNSFDCQTNMQDHLIRNNDKVHLRAYDPDKCVNMYIEVDFDIFEDKGSISATQDYIDGVMNEVAVLYSNEEIEFGVQETVIWDVEDPYTGPTSGNYLDQFRDELNGSYNGDLAHLIGYAGGGGVAYVDVLCNSFYGVGYSGINSSYNEVPVYSWTVEVITHEIGHNLGSVHTHDCAWNGDNTAIDGCGPAAGYHSGCDAPLPDAGTIMSYCHLVGGVGIDFNLGFGPQPGDRIRDKVYNASCLVPCAPCDTEGDPCDDGDDCTTDDVYDANCNCVGTMSDDDGDGVCDAEDQCPGQDDNLDTDNDGTPDCIECTGVYTTEHFDESPLTHSGVGSSTTTLNYPVGTNDISYSISGISQRITGRKNKKYIEEVTVTFVDGNGTTQTYGVYTAPNHSSVDVNIAGEVLSLSVNLKDIFNGSTNSTMSVNLSQVTACGPDGGGCPDDDNDGVCNADDVCPGGNDNIDSDGDGTPDFCDPDSCPNRTDQFNDNPLKHQGTGSSSTSFYFMDQTSDVSFDITNIGKKTGGDTSRRYIDKVTVEYVDGAGQNVLYGTFLGTSINEVQVSIEDIVQSVIVTLEDGYDGNTGSRRIKVFFSEISSCHTPAGLPELINEEISLYPNPSIGLVYVDFGKIKEYVDVYVYDMYGKQLFVKELKNKKLLEIDFSTIGNGSIYFIRIVDKMGRTTTKKVVISN